MNNSIYAANRREASPPNRQAIVLVLLFLLLLLLFSLGCSVRLIGEYDQVIDQSLTDFQQKTETFLSHLESVQGTPDAAFAKNTDFYDQSVAAVNTMRVRAAAEP